MFKTVDARGLSCPVPVIKTKAALDNMSTGTVVVLIDEEVARENVSRLAHSAGCSVTVEAEADEFKVTIVKDGVA